MVQHKQLCHARTQHSVHRTPTIKNKAGPGEPAASMHVCWTLHRQTSNAAPQHAPLLILTNHGFTHTHCPSKSTCIWCMQPTHTLTAPAKSTCMLCMQPSPYRAPPTLSLRSTSPGSPTPHPQTPNPDCGSQHTHGILSHQHGCRMHSNCLSHTTWLSPVSLVWISTVRSSEEHARFLPTASSTAKPQAGSQWMGFSRTWGCAPR